MVYGLVREMQKRDKNLFALSNPDIVELNQENIKNIKDIKPVLETIINSLNINMPISIMASELSVYEIRIDEYAGTNTFATKDVMKETHKAIRQMVSENKVKVISVSAGNLAELKWIVDSYKKLAAGYSNTVSPEQFPIKLKIRLTDKNVTKENIDKIKDYLGTKQLGQSLDITLSEGKETVASIYDSIHSQYPDLQNRDIYIADTKDLGVGEDRASQELLQSGLVFVRLADGIIIQAFDVILDMIGNSNVISENMKQLAEIEIDKFGIIIIRPIEKIDMNRLRADMEQFEKVLIAA